MVRAMASYFVEHNWDGKKFVTFFFFSHISGKKKKKVSSSPSEITFACSIPIDSEEHAGI